MAEDMRFALLQFQRDGIELKKCVEALVAHVESSYGLFHDALQGWARLSNLFESLIQQEMHRGMPREKAILSKLVHGAGSPEKDGVPLHVSTLGERLAACAPGGPNEVVLSNLTLISIFSFWEDRTRGEIAQALRIEKNSIQSELFGDIAKLRNVILHAGSIMDQRTRSMKVLKWFNPGDVVLVDREKLHKIIVLIRNFPEGLSTIGYDPSKTGAGSFNCSR